MKTAKTKVNLLPLFESPNLNVVSIGSQKNLTQTREQVLRLLMVANDLHADASGLLDKLEEETARTYNSEEYRTQFEHLHRYGVEIESITSILGSWIDEF